MTSDSDSEDRMWVHSGKMLSNIGYLTEYIRFAEYDQ